jgi:MFS family permease
MLASMSLLVFFASVIALPMPFIEDLVTLLIGFAPLAFMLGGLMPLLSSTILLTVKENERLVANSISTTVTLVLGLIPSTLTYGFLNNFLKSNDAEASSYPMIVTLYTTVFSSSLLMIGLVTSLKVKQEEKHVHRQKTERLVMKIGDGATKTEFLITKREPLLMYSRSDNESDGDRSNNSSFCSHNDYDQHN